MERFKIGDDTFLVVKPVEKLLQSKMIKDVIQSGRCLCINVQTNELTIRSFPKETKEEHDLLFHTNYYTSGQTPYIRVSYKLEPLLQQLEDLFLDGHLSGCLIVRGTNFSVILDGNFKKFKSEIIKQYTQLLYSLFS